MPINFLRPLSSARSFEREAYAAIRPEIVDALNRDPDEKSIVISTHNLNPKIDPENFSVFFRYIDFGGSGGTYYHFLSLGAPNDASFGIGLFFATSEAGDVSLGDSDSSGYRTIVSRDRDIKVIYHFDGANYTEH